MILYRYSKEKLCLGHSLAFFYRRAHLVRFVSFPKPSHPFTEFPVHFLKKIMQQKKKIMQQKKNISFSKTFHSLWHSGSTGKVFFLLQSAIYFWQFLLSVHFSIYLHGKENFWHARADHSWDWKDYQPTTTQISYDTCKPCLQNICGRLFFKNLSGQ